MENTYELRPSLLLADLTHHPCFPYKIYPSVHVYCRKFFPINKSILIKTLPGLIFPTDLNTKETMSWRASLLAYVLLQHVMATFALMGRSLARLEPQLFDKRSTEAGGGFALVVGSGNKCPTGMTQCNG